MTHKFTQSADGYVAVSHFTSLPCPICEKQLVFHKSERQATCASCGCTHDIHPPNADSQPPAGDPILGALEFHPWSETPARRRLCVLKIYGGPAKDAPIVRPGWYRGGQWYWLWIESPEVIHIVPDHFDFEWALWPELPPDTQP